MLAARSLNVWAKEGRTGPAAADEFADAEGVILVAVESDIVEEKREKKGGRREGTR